MLNYPVKLQLNVNFEIRTLQLNLDYNVKIIVCYFKLNLTTNVVCYFLQPDIKKHGG